VEEPAVAIMGAKGVGKTVTGRDAKPPSTPSTILRNAALLVPTRRGYWTLPRQS